MDQETLDHCLHSTIRELKFPEEKMPQVVLHQVSNGAPQHLGNDDAVRPRYDMWIIGQPSARLYSQMLGKILERHFCLPLNDEQREFLISRVEKNLEPSAVAA